MQFPGRKPCLPFDKRTQYKFSLSRGERVKYRNPVGTPNLAKKNPAYRVIRGLRMSLAYPGGRGLIIEIPLELLIWQTDIANKQGWESNVSNNFIQILEGF